MLVLVMGVCGSGKTTLGRALAKRLGWEFLDADDFHSEENKRKMGSGISLTDEDRWPWLFSIQERVKDSLIGKADVVLACSALKQSYRDIILESGSDYLVVFLHGDKETLLKRLKTRDNHFMNPNLIDSQIKTLEEPSDCLRVAISEKLDEAIEKVVSKARNNGTFSP